MGYKPSTWWFVQPKWVVTPKWGITPKWGLAPQNGVLPPVGVLLQGLCTNPFSSVPRVRPEPQAKAQKLREVAAVPRHQPGSRQVHSLGLPGARGLGGEGRSVEESRSKPGHRGRVRLHLMFRVVISGLPEPCGSLALFCNF